MQVLGFPSFIVCNKHVPLKEVCDKPCETSYLKPTKFKDHSVMIFLVNETDAKITELVLFEKGLNVNTVLRFSYSLGFSKATRVVYYVFLIVNRSF